MLRVFQERKIKGNLLLASKTKEAEMDWLEFLFSSVVKAAPAFCKWMGGLFVGGGGVYACLCSCAYGSFSCKDITDLIFVKFL